MLHFEKAFAHPCSRCFLEFDNATHLLGIQVKYERKPERVCLPVLLAVNYVMEPYAFQLQHRIVQINATCIKLSWNPPKNYPLSNIRCYDVSKSKNGRLITKKLESKKFNMQYLFTALKPFTKYSFAILPVLKDYAKALSPANIEAVTWPAVGQRVKDLRFLHIGHEYIDVTWTVPDDPLGIIAFYKVECTSVETGQVKTFKEFSTIKNLINLKASTTYNISIRTRNKRANGHGGGLGEAVTGVFKTRALVQLQHTIVSQNETSIQISWNPPQNYPRSAIRVYTVFVLGPGDFIQKLFRPKRFRMTRLFAPLKPFTKYSISIYARVNNTAPVIFPGKIQAVTWPSVGQKVLDLTLTAKGPRSVHATWRPPSEPLGIIEAFEISAVNDKTGSEVNYVSNESAITLTGLDPSTTYTISVSVRNKKGEDDNLPLVHAVPERTGGGGGGLGEKVSGEVDTLSLDADIPNHVRAVALSSQSVQVTWKTPNYTLSGEDGYTVMAVGQNLNTTVFVGKEVSSHTFYELQPNTEYTFYVQVKDSIPGVFHPSGQISSRTWPAAQKACGGQKFAPAEWLSHQFTKREAIAHSWPWTVGLYTSTRGPYPFCGGTLIAPDWVITAAHCVEMAMNCIVPPVGELFAYKTFANATLFARIGDHDLKKMEKSERDRVIHSIITHPNFRIESGSSEHDIALLRLQKAVVADDAIDFVCLPRQHSAVPLSKECTFASWGAPPRLSTLPYKNSPVLMEGRLSLETQDFCDSDAHEPQSEGQACFGTGAFNPCWGDNGAGVNCVDAQGQWILYGIINSGSFLCTGQNATSTKILPHLDWIKKTIETK